MIRWRSVAGVLWVVVAGWLLLGVVAVWARWPAANDRQGVPDGGLLAAVDHFDARHYRNIAEQGYAYAPGARSEVAFFPAYPLAGGMASRAAKLGTTAALLTVANVCFAASIVAFWVYLAGRARRLAPDETNAAGRQRQSDRRAMFLSLSVFLLWPPTFFLRMPYSEAMFLLTAIVALDAIQRGRSPVVAALEPIWSGYWPLSPGYCGKFAPELPAWCNLQMANPLWFLAAAALVAWGAGKGWLTIEETLMAAGFLLIPYATRGFEMCMASQGRFASVVFPIYLVLGRLGAAAPGAAVAAVAGMAAVWAAMYAAVFAAGFVAI